MNRELDEKLSAAAQQLEEARKREVASANDVASLEKKLSGVEEKGKELNRQLSTKNAIAEENTASSERVGELEADVAGLSSRLGDAEGSKREIVYLD